MKVNVAFKSEEGKRQLLSYYDDLLKELKIPFAKINIETPWGNTHILSSGNPQAPPMILLHGSSMTSIMWVSDMQKYYKNYRVYAIDIPGEPGYSDERQLSFETSDLEDWLNSVFVALNIEKATVVGASLGAFIGTKFAIKYREKLDNLVLLCPAGIGTQNKSFIFRALFYMLFGEKGIRKLFNIINGNKDIPEEIMKYQILIGTHFNIRKEPIPLFKDEELQRLTMPVLLFVGEKDIILNSLETAHRLKRLLPQSSINIIPNVGHSLINLTDDILKQIR